MSEQDPEALNREGCRITVAVALALWVLIFPAVKACWPS